MCPGRDQGHPARSWLELLTAFGMRLELGRIKRPILGRTNIAASVTKTLTNVEPDSPSSIFIGHPRPSLK